MKSIRFTVYVVSKNYGRFLSSAIESVLKQSVQDFELLLIDDGSTDETASVMNRYEGYEKVRCFRTSGIGLPAVCNLAMREAKGEYLMRLDGDDVLDENILLILGHKLDTTPGAALAFPDYYLMDEFGEVFSQEVRTKYGTENHLKDLPANGACTMIRKKILEELGGYREDLGAQDGFDLWSRVSKLYECPNVNLPLFYYRRHGQNLTHDSFRIMHARRTIKKDAIGDSLKDHRPFIAVIPARQHFDFTPNVWKEKINGISLLEHAIRRCTSSEIFDQIVVTSDTEEVRKTMQSFKDSRLSLHVRKTEETLRTRSIVPSLTQICGIHDPNFQGITVLSYVQSPFVTTATLEEALYTLLMNRTDSSIGVEEIQSPLFKRTRFGLQQINKREGSITSDFDVVYRETFTACAATNVNFKVGSLNGPSTVSFLISADEAIFVNSHRNLKIAQAVAEGLKK